MTNFGKACFCFFAISFLIILGTVTSLAQTTARQKSYVSKRDGFSLRYPAHLKLQVLSGGVDVLGGEGDPNFLFSVTNDAFPVGYSAHAATPGKFFRRLRNTRKGEGFDINRATYQKIENLTIDGRPAVKFWQRFNPQPPARPQSDFSARDVGKRAPPFVRLCVIVLNRNEYWEMYVVEVYKSEISGRVQNSFERILATFRFR